MSQILGHPDSKDVEGSLEKEDLPKSSPDDGGNPDRQQTDEHANPPATPSKQEEENEFILDGFDFSTGLSICQALDEDEDEPDNLKTTGGGGDLLSSKVKNPAELSNALLKALKVGKEESAQPKKQPATSTNTGEHVM